MLAVHRRMREERLHAKMLLQIHDELVFEAPPDEIDRLADLVRDEMRSALALRVPLKVDIKTGDNWAQCE
jgi:DNA polymerase-1